MKSIVSALAGLALAGSLSGCLLVHDHGRDRRDRRDWRDADRGRDHDGRDRHCWNDNGRWVCRD